VITQPFARRLHWRAIAIPIVLVTLALALAIAPAPSPARAASNDILVSLDGVNWSATLPIGLFSGVGPVVPGDRVSRTLWLHNGSSSAAILRLTRFDTAATNPIFSRAISITATSPGATGPIPASAGSACMLLLPDQMIGAGQSTSIVVTLMVADLRGRDAQGQSATIGLLASMSALGGTAASPCPGDGTSIPVVGGPHSVPTSGGAQPVAESDGSLAFTGTRLFYPAIMIASFLTGLGLFVLLAARRRRRAE
jgi:hypothetical protein